MSDAILMSLQVLSLGFVISMFVALLIKLIYIAISASTKTPQPVAKAAVNQVDVANKEEAVNYVETANQEETMVSAEPVVEKPISTRSVSPEIVAVISGAIAALLDDQGMERYAISSIQPAQ